MGHIGETPRADRDDLAADDWRHVDRRRLAVGVAATTVLAVVLGVVPAGAVLIGIVTWLMETLAGRASEPMLWGAHLSMGTGWWLALYAGAALAFALTLWPACLRDWRTAASATFGPPSAAVAAQYVVLGVASGVAMASAGNGTQDVLIAPLAVGAFAVFYGSAVPIWCAAAVAVGWARGVGPSDVFGRSPERARSS